MRVGVASAWPRRGLDVCPDVSPRQRVVRGLGQGADDAPNHC